MEEKVRRYFTGKFVNEFEILNLVKNVGRIAVLNNNFKKIRNNLYLLYYFCAH